MKKEENFNRKRLFDSCVWKVSCWDFERFWAVLPVVSYDGRSFVPALPEWYEYDEDSLASVPIPYVINTESVQSLMDELWKKGVRPSDKVKELVSVEQVRKELRRIVENPNPHKALDDVRELAKKYE